MASSSSSAANDCGLCLEDVSAGCGQAVVTYPCTHGCHLDCIVSASSMRGTMGCPICVSHRNVTLTDACASQQHVPEEVKHEDLPQDPIPMAPEGNHLDQHYVWPDNWTPSFDYGNTIDQFTGDVTAEELDSSVMMSDDILNGQWDRLLSDYENVVGPVIVLDDDNAPPSPSQQVAPPVPDDQVVVNNPPPPSPLQQPAAPPVPEDQVVPHPPDDEEIFDPDAMIVEPSTETSKSFKAEYISN